MEAERGVEHAIRPNQPARQIEGFLHGLPNNLCQVGFFFILIAASLILQGSFDDAMPAFCVFIVGVWFIMLALVLPMAPMAAVYVHPALMELLHVYVFDFRVDLLF